MHAAAAGLDARGANGRSRSGRCGLPRVRPPGTGAARWAAGAVTELQFARQQAQHRFAGCFRVRRVQVGGPRWSKGSTEVRPPAGSTAFNLSNAGIGAIDDVEGGAGPHAPRGAIAASDAPFDDVHVPREGRASTRCIGPAR